MASVTPQWDSAAGRTQRRGRALPQRDKSVYTGRTGDTAIRQPSCD
jgi:hypothetical protein